MSNFGKCKTDIGGYRYSNVINKWFPGKYYLHALQCIPDSFLSLQSVPLNSCPSIFILHEISAVINYTVYSRPKWTGNVSIYKEGAQWIRVNMDDETGWCRKKSMIPTERIESGRSRQHVRNAMPSTFRAAGPGMNHPLRPTRCSVPPVDELPKTTQPAT